MKKPITGSKTHKSNQALAKKTLMQSYNAQLVKERLEQEWPHLFTGQCRPLPIGVDRLIFKALATKEQALPLLHIKAFLKEHCNSRPYLQALVNDRRRYGLRPGSKVGYVSKNQKELASSRLGKLLQN